MRRAFFSLFVILCAIQTAAVAETVTAARTLPAGTVISPEDLTLADPEAPLPEEFFGLETRVMIYEGKPVRASQLVAPTLITRNQLIKIAVIEPQFHIEVEGRALSAGRLGETIRVMNLSSRATLSGEVAADGTVIIRKK